MKTLKEIIDQSALLYAKKIAFRYKSGKEICEKTYDDLKRDSDGFSCSLEFLGLQGKHIAIIGPTSYEWVVSFFGIVNSGSVVIPLDPQLPVTEVCELMDRADVAALVFDQKRADIAQAIKSSGKQLILMRGECREGEALSFQALLSEHSESYECQPEPDQTCAILFTSGTTGLSKGVMLTHRNFTDNVTNLDLGTAPGTVSMTVLPIYHAYALTADILNSIYCGMELCINDSIMHVSQNMRLFRPQIIMLVPMIIASIYENLCNSDNGTLPKMEIAINKLGGRLKTIYSGGAYLPQALIDGFEQYGINVYNCYGMTECSPGISRIRNGEYKLNSVGKLLKNCQAKVVDDEIWVRGSSVMSGYYKMPQETAECLTHEGWLKTGDLGFVDEDGFVFITGRKKNLIILSNGKNISPEELENDLSFEMLVKEIVVKEVNGMVGAEIFPDYDYATSSQIVNITAVLQDIIDQYNCNQPVYKRIVKLIVRDTAFERTPSQKIKRK